MKIVCGACSSKYSIPDEKVAGRSVKIRCKKCGEAIVVRGDSQPASVAAGAWHVVVDGEQRGPLAPAEIGSMIASGTIGWDAYVWREGLAEWKPAQEVQELVAAIMGEPAPAARGAGADLFATESESAFAAGPRADAMTGARNESSVLFSLANLSALGSSGQKSSTPASTSASPRAMASGEGSGLIDIRALASATGLGASTSSAPRPAAKVDDLLGLGAPPLSLGSALAPPVLIAPKPETSRSGSVLVFAAAIIAVGLLGGASALAYVSVGQNDRAAPIAQPPAPIVAAPLVVSPPETPAPVLVATVETSAPIAETPRPIASPRPTTRRPTPVAETPTPPTPPVTTRPTTPRERTLEEMIEEVGHPRGEPHEQQAERVEHAPDPSLPAAPARTDVMSAMTRVTPAVTSCGAGEHGIASVQITIQANGHVSNAVVGGAFAGTPVGSCIARAVRTATVPPFSRATFSLTYPFRL